MATTVRFQGEITGDITIRGPAEPYRPGSDLRQIVNRTWGGGARINTQADTAAISPRLFWPRLPPADMTSLRTFIETDVIEARYLITYTDMLSGVHSNMRYGGGLESFSLKLNTHWTGFILLFKDKGA